jgi:hypothetical protein
MKSKLDAVTANKREMAATIEALRIEHDDLPAKLQQQPEAHWYSHRPALLFKTDFHGRRRDSGSIRLPSIVPITTETQPNMVPKS